MQGLGWFKMTFDIDDGPQTPRQFDIVEAIEEIRGTSSLARMAADSAARRSHYNGECIARVEEKIEAVRGMVLALGGDVADISASLVRIENRLGIAENLAERASGTNEVVHELANLQISQQQISLAARRLRNETVAHTVKVAAAWIFSGAGLASLVFALIMGHC